MSAQIYQTTFSSKYNANVLCEWLTSEVQLAFTQCFIDRHNNNDKKATQRYKKQLPLQCRWSAGEVFDTETNYKPTNIEGTSLRRWTYRNHREEKMMIIMVMMVMMNVPFTTTFISLSLMISNIETLLNVI